ncbi:uncharacterized protein LOC111391935 isoform X2 [Olea europaea var. sylvestris]|uniref:uncharacterized protein LOC111391935 isoform X2 n=1 Tax=Olea europaea var. sylvestris TaxID=158386 RepID=UPI000C1D57BC|nr:uncharacterized protein LOC111391935 isoform X2 [Olea europaea var. sylvestris]
MGLCVSSCNIPRMHFDGCQVIYMRRLRPITECWTEWAMTWIVQEEFYPGPWINLRWCSKPNQAAGCLHSWHLLLSFSLSYTTLLASKRKWKKEKEVSALQL